MAKMAFMVGGLGIPFLGEAGLAVGETLIGIKTSYLVKVFYILSSGDTALGVQLHSSAPFTIKDDQILNRLINEKIDFEIKGFQTFVGDLSVEFKVFDGSNSKIYHEEKSAKTIGICHGGWAIYSKELKLIYPGSSAGEFAAVQMGLLDPDEVRLSKEPHYYGLWEVQSNYQTYFYYFIDSKYVKWFYQLPKRLFGARGDGMGRWEIKHNSQLVIEWDSGSTEKWGMPLLRDQMGKWFPKAGGEHQVFAKRMYLPG
jgi:hypothetical protein